jgi:hypothetical protein
MSVGGSSGEREEEEREGQAILETTRPVLEEAALRRPSVPAE